MVGAHSIIVHSLQRGVNIDGSLGSSSSASRKRRKWCTGSSTTGTSADPSPTRMMEKLSKKLDIDKTTRRESNKETDNVVMTESTRMMGKWWGKLDNTIRRESNKETYDVVMTEPANTGAVAVM